MKILIALSLFFTSITASAFEFDLNTMIGLGYRIDTRSTRNYNDDYKTADKKKQQDNDTALVFAKVFPFSTEQSESKILWGGLGFNYQFNSTTDFSFSPVAWKDPRGLTFSLDLYVPKQEKGGYVGFGVGWSF